MYHLMKQLNNSMDTTKFSTKSNIVNNGRVNGINSSENGSNFPDWINDFHKKCMAINGSKCFEKLDQLMYLYMKHLREEIVLCSVSPNRSKFIASNIYRTMMFFHSYYLSITEFFVVSQWTEHMVELLSIYCQLEMKAAMRDDRGKETDEMVCARILHSMSIYLHQNDDQMIHVLLKALNYNRRHKDLFDRIFRRLLLSNKSSQLTDLEYIRNLLAFKLWKRLYCKEEKRTVTDLALSKLKPPRSFLIHSGKYKFLPRYSERNDVNHFLVTALFDLDVAIKEYFAYIDNNKIKSFESGFCSSGEGNNSETSLFVTEIDQSLSIIETHSETASLNNESFVLDNIKKEIDAINNDDDVSGDKNEDDVIIIDPVKGLAPESTTTATTTTIVIGEVIDLTESDENSCDDSDMPLIWCQELIKLSAEKMKSKPKPTEQKTVAVVVVEEEEERHDMSEITSTSQTETTSPVTVALVTEQNFETVDSTSGDVHRAEEVEEEDGDEDVENNVIMEQCNEKIVETLTSQEEQTELESPPIESIQDYGTHFSTFVAEKEFQKAFSAPSPSVLIDSSNDFFINKTRRVIRTYNSKTKLKTKCDEINEPEQIFPILNMSSSNDNAEKRERRVPKNGEKVVRFKQESFSKKCSDDEDEDDCLSSDFFRKKWNLSKSESSLFLPRINLVRTNRKNAVVEESKKQEHNSPFLWLRNHTKTIIERCNYVNPTNVFGEPSTSHKAEPKTRKRGPRQQKQQPSTEKKRKIGKRISTQLQVKKRFVSPIQMQHHQSSPWRYSNPYNIIK